MNNSHQTLTDVIVSRGTRSRLARIGRGAFAALAAGALTVGLSACAPSAEKAEPVAEAPAEVQTPERIATLSYEATEVLAELGLESHIVMMPEAVRNPVLGSHIEELAAVENTYAVEKELDAETVIDLSPDLVILSPRHGAEDTIGQVLEHAGIETLVTPNGWSTPAEVAENIRLIGDAVGKSAEAEALSAELLDGLTEKAPADDDAPRVLLLSNQAGRPFVTAGNAFPSQLLGLAGATNVSDELGITSTGPIQAEQIVEANPDGIVLIDMNGSGDRLFAEMLDNEAVSGLDSIVQGRVLRVEGRDVQALGLLATVDGLDSLSEWVEGLR